MAGVYSFRPQMKFTAYKKATSSEQNAELHFEVSKDTYIHSDPEW